MWPILLCLQTAVAIAVAGFLPEDESTTTTAAPTALPAATYIPEPREASVQFVVDETSCRRAIVLSDTSRDEFLDKGEYYRFVSRLSNNFFDEYINFDGLPAVLRENYFDLAAHTNTPLLSVVNGRLGRTGTPEEQAHIQNVCQGMQTAMNVAVSGPSGTTTAPSALPPTLLPVSSAPPSTTVAPTLAPAQTTPVPIDMAKCKQNMILSDISRDFYFDENEYVRFVARYTDLVALDADFTTLPEVLQETFQSLANDENLINVNGSRRGTTVSEEQEAFLEQVCRSTLEAIWEAENPSTTPVPSLSPNNATARPTTTTKNPVSEPTSSPVDDGGEVPSTLSPTPAPTALAIQFVVDDTSCRRAIALSDASRDGYLDQGEYYRFISRLSDNFFDEYGNFDGLPAVLQANYFDLAADTNTTVVSVLSGRPGQTGTPEELAHIHNVCQSMQTAMNAALSPDSTATPTTTAVVPSSFSPATSPPNTNSTTETPTRAPVFQPTPVPVDLVTCKRNMVLSDVSRDSHFDKPEYVRFVSRYTDLVVMGANFSTIPEILQETFGDLANNQSLIYIEGARRGTTVSEEQEAYLEEVCRSTLEAIHEAENPSTPVPSNAPSVPTPTTSPAQTVSPVSGGGSDEPSEGEITVYNAFVVANLAGLGAAALESGKNRLALNAAYEEFVKQAVEYFMMESSAVGSPPANETRNVFLRGAQHRQLPVSGLVEDSVDFFDIVDADECAVEGAVCAIVYAAFEVYFEGEISSGNLTAYVQEALVRDDLLQTLLEAEGDGEITIEIAGTTDIVERQEETDTPTQTPVDNAIPSPAPSTVLPSPMSDPTSRPSGGGGSTEPPEEQDTNAPTQVAVNISPPRSGDGDNWAIIAIIAVAVAVVSASGNVFLLFRQRGLERGSNPQKTLSNGIDDSGADPDQNDAEMAPPKSNNFGFDEHSEEGPDVGSLFASPDVGDVEDTDTVTKERPDGEDLFASSDVDIGEDKENVSSSFDDQKQTQERSHAQKEREKDKGSFESTKNEDPWSSSVNNAWESSGGWGEGGNKSGFFGQEKDDDGSRSYDDNESNSGSETYVDGDDFTQEGMSNAGDLSVLPEQMRNLDDMVDKGDWDGVMEAAAQFDENFDDFSVPTNDDGGPHVPEAAEQFDENFDEFSVPSNDDEDLHDVSETDSGPPSGEESETEYGDVGFDESFNEGLSLTSEELIRRNKYREQVEALVRQCVPDDIDNISTMMDQFAGREAELTNTLKAMAARTARQNMGSQGGNDDEEYSDESGSSYYEEVIYSDHDNEDPSYDNDEGSGSYESGSYEDGHESYTEGSGSYEDGEEGYTDGEGSYESYEIEEESYEDHNHSGSYEDEGSYEIEEESYEDGEDDPSGSYEGSYEIEEESYHDDEPSGSYESGEGDYESDEVSYEEGSHVDGEGSYESEEGSFTEGSGSYRSESGSSEDGEGSHTGSGADDDEGSYDDDIYDDDIYDD